MFYLAGLVKEETVPLLQNVSPYVETAFKEAMRPVMTELKTQLDVTQHAQESSKISTALNILLRRKPSAVLIASSLLLV